MSAGRCLRVLFASAEAYPLAKTGGLADVCAALPAALASLGADIRLILPGYPSALDMTEGKQTVSSLPGGGRLTRGTMPGRGLPVYLLDRPDLFCRTGGLYQDSDRRDWPDNHVRFAEFCNAVVHVALHGDGSGWRPDLVHANDWHTGLVPALLALGNSASPPTIFTIHNMAYQGNFPLGVVRDIGLPASLLTTDGAEFYGQISFLKAGIRYADRLTTVSPTYAREILTPEYGAGLDGLLRSRANDLIGILNGIDYTVWDPAKDVNLAECYSVGRMAGKRVCKAAVQEELDLERSDEVPLVSFVNRLTHQKMGDIMLQALPALLRQKNPVGSAWRGREGAGGCISHRFTELVLTVGGVNRLSGTFRASVECGCRYFADPVALRAVRADHHVRDAVRCATRDALSGWGDRYGGGHHQRPC